MTDVYESAVDPTGHFGAAFERDDETAFFYLLDLRRTEDNQIVEAFNVHTVTKMPADAPVAVQWSVSGEAVGLYVARSLIAVFDLKKEARKGRWATGEDGNLFAKH
jgi:hypothetical protein